MRIQTQREVLEIIFESRYSGAKDRLTLALDEYYAVAGVLKLTAKGIAENTLANNKNMNKYAFALNILEAVKLDIATGYEKTAFGVDSIQCPTDPFVRENGYPWELGKHLLQ